MSFRILGTGSALPERVVTNDDLSDFLDTSDEWIFTRTGIKERRICTEETLDDLAMEASRRALDMAGVAAGDLDLIVCSTTTGDHLVPAEACAIAEGLGANCAAFDVSGACAGFVLALDVADGFMARGRASHVLVVAAEQMSRVLDWEDRATCVLFGDGAGAAVISVDEGQNPLAMSFLTTPDVASLNVPGISGTCPFRPADHVASTLSMDGRRVFRFGVGAICDAVKSLAGEAGVAVSDIDHFVFHQANERILSAAVKLLGVDDARVVRTLRSTGNISSACIPLALDNLVRSGELKRGELVALVGFGAGLDTGACLLRWEQ
ncbi:MULTISPECIES: beta-ketoacyl-ACP synthase III [unclassified Collinsella]|uniref:3-oxoacyl-ACP synthase III family protein n=1 Tax=unclassified Collinsella TaxID=2637548 RepID=UPI00319DE093